MDSLDAVVAYAGLSLTAVSIGLTWFYGRRTCALLTGLLRRDNRQ
jgi:hypothetical protein